MDFSIDLFVLVATAFVGGIVARMLRLHTIIGFLIIGLLLKVFFPNGFYRVNEVAQLGLILLLFTTGVELNISKIKKILNVAVLGALIQIAVVSFALTCFLVLLKIPFVSSLVLSVGFSLSSTALVVKTLFDKGEGGDMHTEMLVGWLLVQDLFIIPVLLVINYLGDSSVQVSVLLLELLKSFVVIVTLFFLGRFLLPKLYKVIAKYNSRELFILLTVTVGVGMAVFVSLFGISTTIGAFIAGVILSESLERHTIVAELRPIRDIFVGVFFVSLGFLVSPEYLFKVLPLAFLLSFAVMFMKFLLSTTVSLGLKFYGRASVSIGLALSEVGEFSFVLYSLAHSKNLLAEEYLTLGVVTTIITLICFPLIYGKKEKIYRYILKIVGRNVFLNRMFTHQIKENRETSMENHLIICGFGRVGKWVGKMVDQIKIPYIVIDYNRNIVKELKDSGINVLYGDPSEKEILEAAGIKKARLMILTIPDKIVKEEVVTLAQTMNPHLRIITRAHTDDEALRLKTLNVDKVIQPEFEASIATVTYILRILGKSKIDIKEHIKSLRLSHRI